MESTVCFFELTADDLDAARAFYGDLFGWQITEVPGQDGYLLVRTCADRADALAGGIAKRASGHQTAAVHVAVASLEQATQRATEAGAKVLVPRHALGDLGWATIIEDPQGNALGLIELRGAST